MSEPRESVKNVIADLGAWAEKGRASGNEAVVQRMEGMIDKLSPVVKELNRLYDLTKAFPPDFGSLHDLPPELLAELTISRTDELEDQVVTVINAFGGEASLDQILVGLFRKFGVSQKRRFVQTKLYKMGMVWNVPGRKGVYTTTEPETTQDYMKLHGIEEEDDSDIIPF